MDVEALNEIVDYSPLTLQTLADTIGRSRSPEQLIYRECELDELWRMLDLEIEGIQTAAPAELPRLVSLRDEVMKAHDLIGVEGNCNAAAICMRAAAT
jgi:hypothetical protein